MALPNLPASKSENMTPVAEKKPATSPDPGSVPDEEEKAEIEKRCDEVFMTGTAAHVTPVVELDRRAIGSGKMGPITGDIVRMYFDIIKGNNPKYSHWCTPCYSRVKA